MYGVKTVASLSHRGLFNNEGLTMTSVHLKERKFYGQEFFTSIIRINVITLEWICQWHNTQYKYIRPQWASSKSTFQFKAYSGLLVSSNSVCVNIETNILFIASMREPPPRWGNSSAAEPVPRTSLDIIHLGLLKIKTTILSIRLCCSCMSMWLNFIGTADVRWPSRQFIKFMHSEPAFLMRPFL